MVVSSIFNTSLGLISVVEADILAWEELLKIVERIRNMFFKKEWE